VNDIYASGMSFAGVELRLTRCQPSKTSDADGSLVGRSATSILDTNEAMFARVNSYNFEVVDRFYSMLKAQLNV
jgi:hypothetical protein